MRDIEAKRERYKSCKKWKEFLFFFFFHSREEESIRIYSHRWEGEEELVKLESRGKFYSEEVSLFPLIFVFLLLLPPLISIRISSLWTFTGGASSIEGGRGQAAAGTFNKAIANLVWPIKRAGKGKVTLSETPWPSLSSYPGSSPPPPVSCLIPPSITQHKGICSNSWPNYWLW